MIEYEPYIQERIDIIEKEAREVINGQLKSDRHFELYLRNIISKFYGIPIFDPYFDKLTINQMIFEWLCIKIKAEPIEQRVSKELNTEYKDDLAKIADEMETLTAAKNKPVDEKELERMKDFMKTGKFIGEK